MSEEPSAEPPVDIVHEVRAERLKESLYLTFAALAVTLTMGSHGDVTAREALVTLVVTLGGTVLAVFTAQLVAHVAAHEKLMTRVDMQRALLTSFGALPGVAPPFVFLGISALTGWEVSHALQAATVALIAALVIISYVGVRRAALRWWQRILVLAVEGALGIGVVALELLAHG